ncbi:glycosyltransferase family 61 protein, partial [uncultured Variovorax sp.]
FRTLAHMQATVFRKFEIDPAQKGHRKIFLARRSGRNITNTIELEEVLASFGYEIIDTGLLSFEQQVRLFSEASAIVGAMGAAFTNLIFCRPGTQVLALSSPYTQLFCSQSNMALFAGCEYRILTGEHPLFNPGDEHTVSDPSLFLDSYAIDATKLAIALADIEPRAN